MHRAIVALGLAGTAAAFAPSAGLPSSVRRAAGWCLMRFRGWKLRSATLLPSGTGASRRGMRRCGEEDFYDVIVRSRNWHSCCRDWTVHDVLPAAWRMARR